MIRTIVFAGDVMTGRGIDQALPCPGDPSLHEPGERDARTYLKLAEAAGGPVGPLALHEIWGDALGELARVRPQAVVVNLETSITTSDDWCREKEVHYRMHPANVGCLAAAGIDVAVLANNHVMDWGRAGLLDTLDSLAGIGIRSAGAGRDEQEASRPAVVELGDGAGPGGRILVWGVGSTTSGIPTSWRAGRRLPGIELLPNLSATTASRLCKRANAQRRDGDLTVVSIHWGTNWGHDVPAEFRSFAHRLIDAGIDVVHGHSSHHVRPIEVYRDRLILYGCGDFLDDYEGISGHESWRADLAVMFLVMVDAVGRLEGVRMVPFRMQRFRLRRAGDDDCRWLAATLSRTSEPFGCGVEFAADAVGPLRLTQAQSRSITV